jgi:hypothetical protein
LDTDAMRIFKALQKREARARGKDLSAELFSR